MNIGFKLGVMIVFAAMLFSRAAFTFAQTLNTATTSPSPTVTQSPSPTVTPMTDEEVDEDDDNLPAGAPQTGFGY